MRGRICICANVGVDGTVCYNNGRFERHKCVGKRTLYVEHTVILGADVERVPVCFNAAGVVFVDQGKRVCPLEMQIQISVGGNMLAAPAVKR